jgi:hypothetical protein
MIIPPFYRPMSDLLFQAARRSPENIILLSLYTFISIFSSNSTDIPKKNDAKNGQAYVPARRKFAPNAPPSCAMSPILYQPSALPVPL